MHEIIETYVTTTKLDGFDVTQAIETLTGSQYYDVKISSNLIAYDCIMLFEDKFCFYVTNLKLSEIKDLVASLGLECYVKFHNNFMHSLNFVYNDPYMLIESLVKIEDAIIIQ